MSTGYEIYLEEGDLTTITNDTKGKVEVLPYPNEKYAHEMCLLKYRGAEIECVRSGDVPMTLVYRYNGFQLDSFIRCLRRAYPAGTVHIKYVG